MKTTNIIALGFLALAFTGAEAITIDPSEYFAYDYGLTNDPVFLSKKPCQIAEGVGEAMTKQHLENCDGSNPDFNCKPVGLSYVGWKKAVVYGGPREMPTNACWKNIGTGTHIVFCIPNKYAGQYVQCSTMRKITFMSTKGLQPAPIKADPF